MSTRCRCTQTSSHPYLPGMQVLHLPSHMLGHLKEHGFKNIDKITFTAACECWGIIQLPEHVLHPSPRGAPVEILKTYQEYACAVDPTGCSFACISENWMKQYVRNNHTSHPALMTSCYQSKRSCTDPLLSVTQKIHRGAASSLQ